MIDEAWHYVDIKNLGEFSDAFDLALTGGLDNMGWRAPEFICVRDEVLAVQLKLTYG